MTDSALLTAYLNDDDRDALEVLITRYAKMVHAVCRQSLRDSADVEDAFQATFLVLVSRAHRIRHRRSVRAWLCGVAYRISRRVREKCRTTEALTNESLLDQDDDPYQEVERRYSRQVLHQELCRLREEYREVLILKYFEAQTASAIAECLGVTVGTIEGRLQRGKQQLKRRLARRGLQCGLLLTAWQLQASSALASSATSSISRFQELNSSSGFSSQPYESPPQPCLLARKEIAAMTTIKPATLAAVMLLPILFLVQPGHGQNTDVARGDAFAIETQVNAGGGGETEANNGDPFGVAGDSVTTDDADVDTSELDRPEPGTADPHRLKEAWKSYKETTDQKIRSLERELAAYRNAERATEAQLRELKIQAALSQKTMVQFFETPLTDVVDYLSDVHEIEILIDERAFDEIGMAFDEPVTLVVKDVSLASALNLMTEKLDLGYTIEDEILKITSQSVAFRTKNLRFYAASETGLDVALMGQLVSTFCIDEPDVRVQQLPDGVLVEQNLQGHLKLDRVFRLSRQSMKQEQGAATSNTGSLSSKGSSQVATETDQATESNRPSRARQPVDPTTATSIKRTIKIHTLKFTQAAAAKEMVDQIFAPTKLVQSPEFLPVIVADEARNVLIVSAGEPEHKTIADLLQKIDTDIPTEMGVGDGGGFF